MAVSIGFGGSFFKSRELRAVIGDANGEQTRYGGCGGAEAHDRSNCAPTKWRKSTQLSRSRRILRTAGMGQDPPLSSTMDDPDAVETGAEPISADLRHYR